MLMMYEEWLESQDMEETEIRFAESGRDRDGDFNLEDELENAYEHYLLLGGQPAPF
jgi:hypothetical protein